MLSFVSKHDVILFLFKIMFLVKVRRIAIREIENNVRRQVRTQALECYTPPTSSASCPGRCRKPSCVMPTGQRPIDLVKSKEKGKLETLFKHKTVKGSISLKNYYYSFLNQQERQLGRVGKGSCMFFA